ncbi:hypothetical protein ACWGII_14205 [Streptomyces sp. NPDC054855]
MEDPDGVAPTPLVDSGVSTELGDYTRCDESYVQAPVAAPSSGFSVKYCMLKIGGQEDTPTDIALHLIAARDTDA